MVDGEEATFGGNGIGAEELCYGVAGGAMEVSIAVTVKAAIMAKPFLLPSSSERLTKDRTVVLKVEDGGTDRNRRAPIPFPQNSQSLRTNSPPPILNTLLISISLLPTNFSDSERLPNHLFDA